MFTENEMVKKPRDKGKTFKKTIERKKTHYKNKYKYTYPAV